jgi:acetyltransferase-like isoleucine patch superfamily enzyme
MNYMVLKKIGRILSLPLYDQFNVVALWWYRAKGALIYRRVLGSFGKKSAIYPPMLISGAKFIHIGDRVVIRKGVRIEAIMLDPENPPEIHIGNNVNIEQDVHIVAMGKIHIHDNASITARSALLCGTHPFFDVHSAVKIGDRLAGERSVIEIGEGAFLGIGSIIQMNVRIGRHVVVGSGSVVKKSVPDYCVVDGNPAAVVLQHISEEDRWAPPAKNR